MTDPDSIEIVRGMYEAFHRGDAETSLSYFDPDVSVDLSRRVDGGIGRGPKDVNSLVSGWLGAWDDWSEEIEEMRGQGDRVYVVATQRGRGKGSGIEVENRYAVVYEVRHSKIVEMTLYGDPVEALEAAGLKE